MKTETQKLYSHDTDHPSIRGARGSRTTDYGSLSRRNFLKTGTVGMLGVLAGLAFAEKKEIPPTPLRSSLASAKTHKYPNMDRFPPEKIKLRENVNDFKTAEKMWNECNTKLPEKYKPIRKMYLKSLKEKNNNSIRKWYQGYYADTIFFS